MNSKFRWALGILMLIASSGWAQAGMALGASAQELDWQNIVNTDEKVACKVSEDCMLIMGPCGTFDAYNRKFEKEVKEDLKTRAMFKDCDEVIAAKNSKMKGHIAKCTNRVCRSQQVKGKE